MIRDSTSYFPGGHKALETLNDEDATAIFYSKEGLLYHEEFRCDILGPWETEYPGFLTMAFPKNSSYFPFFHYQTIRHFESGVLFALRNRWTTFNTDHCKTNEPSPLGLEKLISLFGLLAVSSLAAIFVFALEKISSIERSKTNEKVIPVKRDFWPSGRGNQDEIWMNLDFIVEKFQIREKKQFTQEMQKLLLLSKRANKS